MSDTPYRSPEQPPGLSPYVSTGRTPLVGLVAGLGAGTGAALVLSVIYAYGTLYIPIVQIEFLLTVLFGAAVGASVTKVMHAFKVRSRFVVIAAALVLGIFAWAFSWLPWIYGTFSRFEVPVTVGDVFDPLYLLGAITQIYETGTWSIGSSSTSAVSGGLLGFVWVVEAATIIGFSTFVAVSTSADRVFCEKCDSWCTVAPDRALYDIGPGEVLRSALPERADLSVLERAPRPRAKERLPTLQPGFCTGCGETNVLALDDVKQTVDNKGNATRTPRPFVPFHCISRGDMQELQSKLGAPR